MLAQPSSRGGIVEIPFVKGEDGMRYWSVTGVQTCALPILSSLSRSLKTELVKARCSGAYAEGRVYYVDENGALVAAPVDLAAGKLTAAPQAIASKTARSPSTYYGSFSVSQ